MKKSKLKQARKVAMLLSASLLIEQPALINPVLYVHAQEDTSIACDLEESVTEAEVEDSTAEITSEDSENEAIIEMTDETSEEVEVTKETDETEASEEVTTAEAEESKEEATKDDSEETTESETESATDEATTTESENLTTENITTQDTITNDAKVEDTITNDAKVEDIDILEAEGDPSSSDVTKRFTDIKTGEWYVDAVQFVSDQKIMNGVSDYTFAPKMTLTREQFITVLYNMEGAPETTFKQIFDDVKDATSWYAKSVTWASENKITSGIGDGKFGTGAEITREQLATLLYNYTQQKDKNKLTINQDAVTEFPDATQISDWASEGMKWAVTNGVMKGKAGNDGKNHLDPGGKASRAECAQMIKNFVDANGGEEQQEHNYQDGSAIIKVEGFDQKDSMVVTDEKITLKGTVSNADEVSEFTCSKHSAADETVKALDVNGVAEWTAKDITLDIGTNYITFVVKNNKGEEFMKEVRIIRDSTVLKAADNVVSFNVNDEKQLKDVEQIYEQILDVWKDDKDTETTDDDEICIAVNETNPLLGYIQKGNIKPGDVVYIPENDYFITDFNMIYNSHDDKVPDDVEGYDASKHEVIHMSEASIMDLIDGDISINMNEIDMEDPIAFVYNPYSEYLQDEPEVLAGEAEGDKEFETGNDKDVKKPGLQLQNLASSFTPTVDLDAGEIKVGFSKMIIYDEDGDPKTKNDRIFFDGNVKLSNIDPTFGVEWHNVLPDQIIGTIDCNNEVSGKITIGKGLFDTSAVANNSQLNNIKEKLKGFKFDNKREKFGALGGFIKSLEGVDTGNTLFLGVIGVHLGGEEVEFGDIHDISNKSFDMKLNPILMLMFFVDMEGEVKANFSIEYKQTGYLKMGKNIQRDGYIGKYGSVTENWGTKNEICTYAGTTYHVNDYCIYQKSKDNNGESEKDFTFAMKGDVNFFAGPGIGEGIMVMGIMPLMAKVSVGPKISMTGDFKVNISNYPHENSTELFGRYVEAVGDLYASVSAVLRGKFDVKIKGKTSLGNPTIEMSYEGEVPIWKAFEFSTIPITGYVYEQDYDEDESNDIPIAGATVTLSDEHTFNAKTYTVTTDENGYYEFDLFDTNLSVVGSYYRTVSQKGYEDCKELIKVKSSTHNESTKVYLDRKYNSTFGTVTIGKGSNVNDYKNAHIRKVIIESDGAIVGERPFECSLIEEVEIIDGVTTIPRNIFYNSVIRQISIPDSVTTVDEFAFCLAKLPKNFKLEESIKKFKKACFSNAYIGAAKIILNQDTEIEINAFAWCKINEVILNAKMNASLDNPFYCATIEKVTISDTVTVIQRSLFMNATIHEIKIPDNVTELEYNAFYNTTLPRTFKMGTGIKNLGESCFVGVDLSNTVISINGNMTLGNRAFEKCKIKAVYLNSLPQNTFSLFSEATIDKVVISDTITTIPNGCFFGATINDIEIPDNVTELGNSAFANAKLPKTFQIGKGIKIFNWRCFEDVDLSNIKITISDGMVIKAEAFGYTKIKEVELLSDSNVYASTPFQYTEIEKVSISDNVMTIPKSLFADATIKDIKIPNSVKQIKERAFYNATLPEDFSLPKGVRYDRDAFSYSNYNPLLR